MRSTTLSRQQPSLLRQDVLRYLRWQLWLIAIVSLGWLAISWQSAMAALLGGVVSFLPGLYFAWRFTGTCYARQVKVIVRAFYGGALVKLVMTAVLAVIVFNIYPAMLPLPFISNLVLCAMAIWFAPLAMNRVLA